MKQRKIFPKQIAKFAISKIDLESGAMDLKFIKVCPIKRTQADSHSRVLFQSRARNHRSITINDILRIVSGCDKSMDEIEADRLADFMSKVKFGDRADEDLEDATDEFNFGMDKEDGVSATNLMTGNFNFGRAENAV